jgi:ribosome-associated protein
MLRVNERVSIPNKELTFTYGTSTGPGGQHVNRVSTKATLLFDVGESESLSKSMKQRIRSRYSTRINKLGVLRVSSSKHRSQRANKDAATKKFLELLKEALKTVRPRRKTKIPRSSKIKRIESKKKRGETKRLRGKVQPENE